MTIISCLASVLNCFLFLYALPVVDFYHLDSLYIHAAMCPRVQQNFCSGFPPHEASEIVSQIPNHTPTL